MALTVLQPLEQLAAVKVALAVFNDDINQFFDEVILRKEYNEDQPFDFYKKRGERRWIRKSQKKARNELFELIPKSPEDRVVLMLHAIIDEIHYWLRDHYYVLKDISKIYYKNSLCWKLEGTIDRINTAKKFIQNERIDKRNRFVMACNYFLENDVKHLFESMTADERQTILEIDSNIAVHFWMKWLRESNSPWTECVPEYLTYNFLLGIEGNNRIRLVSFFSQLSKNNKSLFLHFLCATQCGHINDVLTCYNLLDETARAEIIQSLLRPVDVLCCYLNWPFQSLFLDAVNQMKSHLNCFYFEFILNVIVHKKLMSGMQDYDYLNLLRDFWNQIPGPYKEETQQKWIFILVNAALSSEIIHPRYIQKLLMRKVKTEFNPDME